MKKNICVVSSNGGHFLQIYQLLNILKNHNLLWVTFKKEDTLSLLKSEKIIFGYSPTNRNLFNLIRNFFLALYIFIFYKIDILISAGAGIAIPFFILGKIFGKKTIFIESISRIYKPSLTAKVVYYFSDYFFVQWENLKKYFPKSIYKGKIL